MNRITRSSRNKRRKSRKIRIILLLSAITLILSVAAVATLAWIADGTEPLVNIFEPTKVASGVEEQFDGNIKSDVKIKNIGSIDAYIRVALVAAWTDEQGNVAAELPIANEDYSITLNTGSQGAWFLGDDGYYYCRTKVAPGERTPVLVHEGKPLKDNNGLHLELQILSSAIQAEPDVAVQEAWPLVEVSIDGSLQPKEVGSNE